MEKGTILKHVSGKFTVQFKCMVNEKEFKTIDDFQFRLDQFTMTIEQMESALKEHGFFIGGLTDEGIIFHFNKIFK